MSHNLVLSTIIQIKSKNRKNKIIDKPAVEYFPLFQTPTKVTFEVLKSSNPKEKYIHWVIENFSTSIANEHVEKLDNWIKNYDNNIRWESN